MYDACMMMLMMMMILYYSRRYEVESNQDMTPQYRLLWYLPYRLLVDYMQMWVGIAT